MRLFSTVMLCCLVWCAGCQSFATFEPIPTGTPAMLTAFPDQTEVFLLEEYRHDWGTAALWLRFTYQEGGPVTLAHLLEHILLERLRQEYPRFLWHAETNPEFMFFRCSFVAGEYAAALAALSGLRQTPRPDAATIERCYRQIVQEKFAGSRPAVPLPYSLWQKALRTLHSRYFRPGQQALVIFAPVPAATALTTAATAWAHDENRIESDSATGFAEAISALRAGGQLAQDADALALSVGKPTLSAAAKSFTLNLTGPRLESGSLAYFKLAQLYLGDLWNRREEGGYRIDVAWQIGQQKTVARWDGNATGATCQPEWDKRLREVWEQSLAEPPTAERFAHYRKELYRSYHNAGDGVIHTNFLLGQAWAGAYLADFLQYPVLLNTATPEDFHLWWQEYVAQSEITCADTAYKTVSWRFSGHDGVAARRDRFLRPSGPIRTLSLARRHKFTPEPPSILALDQGSVAVLAQTPPDDNAAISIFVPTYADSGNRSRAQSLGTALSHEVKRLQGRTLWEETPQYALVTAMVCQEDLGALVTGLSRTTWPQPCATGETQAVIVPPLAFPQTLPAGSKTVLYLHGQVESGVWEEWARMLCERLQGTPPQPSPALPSQPGNTADVYIFAAAPIPLQMEGDTWVLPLLDMCLAQAIYQKLLTPGTLYHAGSFYRPEVGGWALFLWARVLRVESNAGREHLQNFLRSVSATTLTYEDFVVLWEKAYLYRMLQNDSVLQHSHETCQKWGIWYQHHPAPPERQHYSPEPAFMSFPRYPDQAMFRKFLRIQTTIRQPSQWKILSCFAD